jgi:hypothetical protein
MGRPLHQPPKGGPRVKLLPFRVHVHHSALVVQIGSHLN